MNGIAIIDDGLTNLTDNIIICNQFECIDGEIIHVEKSNEIKCNHGSLCAALIAQTPTNFYSIKIINDGYTANIYDLKSAIEFAINLDINIIHISLGSYLWIDGYILSDLILKAKSKNIFIVGCISPDGRRTFPGSFTNVVGVCYANIKDYNFICCDDNVYNINVFTDIKTQTIRTNIGLCNIPLTSSYATALITNKLSEWLKFDSSLNIEIKSFYKFLKNICFNNHAENMVSIIEKTLLRKTAIQLSINAKKSIKCNKNILKVNSLKKAINKVQKLDNGVVFSRDFTKNEYLKVDNMLNKLKVE